MSDTNVVVLKGRLTRDAVAKQAGELSILEFSLAVNDYIKGSEYTHFIGCVMFGKRASSLNGKLTKGLSVVVAGKLKQDRWVDNGQKRSRIGVVVNDLSFAGAPRQRSESDSSPNNSPNNSPDAFMDDLPF